MGTSKQLQYVADASAAYRAELSELVATRESIPTADPAEVGRQAALRTLAAGLWEEEVGPFHDTAGVRAVLGGISRQAVADRVAHRRLLVLRMGPDGRALRYPAWQFDGQTLTVLGDLLKAIRMDPDIRWHAATVAAWLNAADDRLGGRRPRELLADGRLEGVLPLVPDVRHQLGADEGRLTDASAVA